MHDNGHTDMIYPELRLYPFLCESVRRSHDAGTINDGVEFHVEPFDIRHPFPNRLLLFEVVGDQLDIHIGDISENCVFRLL
jgi:hypothetical protein